MKKLFAMASFLLLLAFVRPLSASCCGGASAGGVQRLLAHERAAITFLNDSRRHLGFFDREARFRFGDSENLNRWQINHELQAVARINSIFSPFCRIPLVMNISDKKRGTNLGDMSAGLLIAVMEEDLWPYWPSLNMNVSMKMPSGVAKGDNKAIEPEQITSTGTYDLSWSLLLQRTFGPVVAGLGYALNIPLAYFKTKASHPGLRHSPSLHASFNTHEKGRLQLSLTPNFSSSYVANGKAQPNSTSRQLMLSVGYNLELHSHLSLLTSLGAHLPIDQLGKRSIANAFAQVGLRFGIF